MAEKQPAPYKVKWEKALLRESKLPLPAIAVGMAFASYASSNGQDVFPSQETLASDLGSTVRTVSKWTRTLEDGGFLRVAKRGNQFTGSTRYILAIPEHRNDPSGACRDEGEHRNDHVRAPERSRQSTGTITSEHRNERSGYQHKTNTPTNTDTKAAAKTLVSPSQFDPEAKADRDRLSSDINPAVKAAAKTMQEAEAFLATAPTKPSASGWATAPQPDLTPKQQAARERAHSRMIRDENYTGDDDPSLRDAKASGYRSRR